MVHVYNGILHRIKKNEIMLFAATQMDLEIVILSEVREGEISHDISHIWKTKRNDVKNLLTKQTHRLRK